MTSARHIARNSLVQFAGRGVTMGVSLAILTLLSRYLGPYEFGQYQLVIAFLLLVNVSDLGIATIAVRHLSTERRPAEEIIGNILTIRAVLAAASTLLCVVIAVAIGYSHEATKAIAIASLSFPFMMLTGSYNALFASKLRMEYAAMANIAQALATLALMAVVVMMNGGVVRLLIAYDAGFVVSSAVSVFFARRFLRPAFRLDRTYAGEIIKESLPLGSAVVVIAVYSRIDILLLKAFTDSESVGYYGFAYRAVDLAAPLSLMFVGSVFPLLSSHHAVDDRDAFRTLLQRSQDFLTVLGITMLTLMILFARPLVDLVGGAKYAPSVMSVRILAMAFGLIWLSNLMDHGLIAVGRQKVLLWNAALGLAVNVGANLVLIPLYGREGAATSTVLTEIAVLAPAVVVLSGYIGGVPSFWVAWRLLPVALVAGAVVYFLNLPWFTEAAISCVILAVGVAAARVISIDEVRMLLRREKMVPVEAGTRR
jgi:O-antigen/teichoic acid export membrane protein